MPNQRSRKKKIVSTYVDEDLKKELQRLAKSEGKTLTDLITEMIKEKTHGKKTDNG